MKNIHKSTTHAPHNTASTHDVAPLDEVAGFEGSYRAFEAEALGVEPHEVSAFTANPMVAFHNMRTGVQAVLAARAQIEGDPEAPKVDFERVARAVRAAEALVFACRRASNTLAARSDTQARIAVVYELRDTLLANAEAAVKSGALVGEQALRVEAIRKGKGSIDAAQDCIDLASLFHDNAPALHSKTFVTPDMLERARTLGSELLHLLLPNGVKTRRAAADPAAAAATVRDQMAVVLQRHHAYVARVGGWLWGLDVSERVPPLRSRKIASEPQRPSAPAPTPAQPA